MEDRTIRGADALAEGLSRAGADTVFALSGNHVMPVFDALLDHPGIALVHTRHEAAAVHMADAHARLAPWRPIHGSGQSPPPTGRLAGRPGIALVTGGQGHANAVAALPTAMAGEVPLVPPALKTRLEAGRLKPPSNQSKLSSLRLFCVISTNFDSISTWTGP